MEHSTLNRSSSHTSNDGAMKSSVRTTTRSLRGEGESEISPLLPRETGRPEDEPRRVVGKLKTLRSARSIMFVMLLVVALTTFGDQVKESPEMRILESVICYRYYEKNDPSKIRLSRDVVGPGAIGGVAEMHCKADGVQNQLAMLLGYQSFLDGFPNLILALPFGWAADRYGRWPFLFLNLANFALRTAWSQLVTWNWQIFDVRMMWISSAFSLFGGGSSIASSLFFVVISDVTPSGERAAIFLRAGAASLSANVFMPPLAAALMEFNPWIPYLLATSFQILATLLYMFAPETLNYRKANHQEEGTSMNNLATTKDADLANFASRWYSAIKSSTAFLINDWRVPTLISTFVAHNLTADIGRLLLQYCSKRYAVSLSKATLLLLVRNGVNSLLLLVIFPYLAKDVMHRMGWCSQSKDLYLARMSQAVSAFGWLIVAMSPSITTVTFGLVFTSLGTGASLLVRSFLTSILEPQHIGKAYSIISMVSTLGEMFGAPLLAGLFAKGLVLGDAWMGLPFYLIALLTMSFAGQLIVVRLRKGEDETGADEVEQ